MQIQEQLEREVLAFSAPLHVESLEMVCKVHALVPLIKDEVQPRREDRDQDRAKCSRADWLEQGRMRGEGSALDPLFAFSSTNRHSATKVATKLQPGISS